jgi:hypothetical protein
MQQQIKHLMLPTEELTLQFPILISGKLLDEDIDLREDIVHDSRG